MNADNIISNVDHVTVDGPVSVEALDAENDQYPTPRVIDSKKIYERLKNKVRFWKSNEDEDDSFNKMDKRQQELWKLIRDSPHKFTQGEGGTKENEAFKQKGTVEGSANTFLTQNEKGSENDHFAEASPMKITALDHSPLYDVNSSSKEVLGPSPIIVEKLTDKFLFKKVGLKRIQERLVRIADAKESVAKNYTKLASEITAWCSLCLERDSELELLTDLQQVLATDKKSEHTMARLFVQINNQLEYVAKREENMLQERKDMNTMIKKYDNLRVKKGDQSMETQYLKENLHRKRTSLQQLTEQYYEALSKILREEFTRACFTIYEMGSDLKEVTRQFSLQSIELLRNSNDPSYMDEFLEEVRKLRADKQWSKLSMQEKNNPAKLAELVGNLYNGQDSLLRVASDKVPIKFSPMPLHENASINSLDPLKFDDNGPLDLSVSQYGTDKYNDITTNKYLLKKPLFSAGRPISHPMATLQNLRAPISSHGGIVPGSAGKGMEPNKFGNRYKAFLADNTNISTPQFQKAPHTRNRVDHNYGSNNDSNPDPYPFKKELTGVEALENDEVERSDDEVVIKFGHDLNNSFLEAEQLLATNAWD